MEKPTKETKAGETASKMVKNAAMAKLDNRHKWNANTSRNNSVKITRSAARGR